MSEYFDIDGFRTHIENRIRDIYDAMHQLENRIESLEYKVDEK